MIAQFIGLCFKVIRLTAVRNLKSEQTSTRKNYALGCGTDDFNCVCNSCLIVKNRFIWWEESNVFSYISLSWCLIWPHKQNGFNWRELLVFFRNTATSFIRYACNWCELLESLIDLYLRILTLYLWVPLIQGIFNKFSIRWPNFFITLL